ncbi:acetyl-CoA acetyltransferase [Mycobacterium sp. E342]|uniref:thiolase family protein n=1 Tax=unclassified Mycobacterium TaxID=2642494 RepID=UPI00080138D2|nr:MULTISPECIES: thiolase family protein [unclassified Mycobacterium]OBH11760.1 acetyl-CoA acetyltransferase [Mycobacterium sp. E3247]OBH37724.1 acetyl-CoA acetyltransferase [Mycobacterium sp. E342]
MSGKPINSMKDHVAIAGAATTGFVAANSGRSQTSLAAQAAIEVIRACGLTKDEIDGLCGSWPSANELQSVLGLPRLTWSGNPMIPLVDHVATAAAAVYSGLCETVLVYHAAYRAMWNSGGAWKDPFRRIATSGLGDPKPGPETMAGAVGYTGWASRYIYEYDVPREDFGLVALNARANAARNPAAAMRDPLTMDEYLGARLIREPLCLYDMDPAVDGGDAFIVTTTERARDLALPAVLINAAVLGQVAPNEEDQTLSLRHNGQHVVVNTLKAKSDFWIDDIDVYFPYDGFTPITLNWMENVGWCKPGEAGNFLRQHWDAAEGRVLINGKIPVNPHGGSLSEGATQASGHIREAVHQLQGLAGERQVPNARRALITAGGFFFNAQGLALHTD